MYKFQKIGFKFTASCFFLLLLCTGQLFAQDNQQQLDSADSLFQNQKYTESFEHYAKLYDAGYTSPAMLLRMAYIKEGLGNVSEALFYLNEYQLLTNNKAVLKKMEKLADANELSGYQYSDADFIIGTYRRFELQLLMMQGAFILLFTGLMVWYRRRYQRKPVGFAVSNMVFILLLLFSINAGRLNPQGIIYSDETYLMSQPSAGADLVEVISKGHKVSILDQDGVWVKIKWKDEVAFVREKNIRPLL